MRRGERGTVLVEVLAAVMILSVAGLSLVQLVAEATRAATVARAREREMADENRLMTALTLLTGPDLDRRLGTRTIGAHAVTVQRPQRALYRIAVGRTTAPEVEDLVTVVHRAEPADAR